MKRCNKIQVAGFTLVELLVVISIIAVLLAVLIPSLQKARETASRVVCSSNLHQFGIASSAYHNDYKKFWVNFDTNRSSYWIYFGYRYDIGGGKNIFPYWMNHGLLLYGNYMKTPKIFYCPSSSKAKRRTIPGNPEYGPLKYDDYFVGDNLKAKIVTDIGRSSYMCRTYDIVNGKLVRIGADPAKVTSIGTPPIAGPKMGRPATFGNKNSLNRLDGKLAFLTDTFSFGNGGHQYRFYNVLYCDGSVNRYDDREEWLTGANESRPNDPHWSKKTFQEAGDELEERFGPDLINVIRTAGVPLSWLFLDKR